MIAAQGQYFRGDEKSKSFQAGLTAEKQVEKQ
jgi:hypothetical protein